VTEVELRLGQKGQVVIPKIFRDELEIAPGSPIKMRAENKELIISKESKINPIEMFEQIANSIGKKRVEINLHGVEEEAEERWARAKR